MLPSLREFLEHILIESRFIEKYTAKLSYEQFIDDEVLCRACIRSLEIIGEAVKKIPPDFRLEHPQPEWKRIAGLRDILIHHYFGVDYELVWDVIQNKLPLFQEQVEEILNEEN
jgi:uncharacterized protein with HEPN domain